MNKKQIGLIVGLVLISLMALIGTSYAIFTKTLQGEKPVTVSVGTLKVDFTEGNKISLENTAPMSDSKGEKTSPYTFTVTNNGTIDAYYKVYLEEDSTNTLDRNFVKYSLTGSDGYNSGVKTVGKDGINLVPSTKILKKGTVTYTLRMWLSSEADNSAQGKSYGSKIVVESSSSDMPAPTFAQTLIKDANPVSVTAYADGDKTKMYTFRQPAREQQAGYTAEELTEYRYIGKTPNNYITFNGEPWRIIGVFTVEDKKGVKEQRVKIMRDASIENYSWDNTNIETEYGKNRWSDARLNYLLNPGHESESIGGSLYWNKGSGTCYSGQNNGTTSCNFTSTGLTSDAKSKIEEAKWYLGGYDWSGTPSVEVFHEKERGTTIYSSTTYPRETSWVGSVGLMYPSDYGYTYSLGVDTTCYGNLNNCYSLNGGVPANGWMFNSSYQWTLSSHSSYSYRVFNVISSGRVDYFNAYGTGGVRPCVYLKSDIQLTGGSGTSSDPYTIE